MPKRTYGTGSLRERPNSPGVFEARVRVNGQQRWFRFGSVASPITKTAAERELALLVMSGTAGDSKVPKVAAVMTVGDLLEEWHERRSDDWSPLTVYGVRHCLDSLILPSLGALPLKSLTRNRIEDAYRDWEKSGRSKTTVHRYGANLRSALRYADERGYPLDSTALKAKVPAQARPRPVGSDPMPVKALAEKAEATGNEMLAQMIRTLLALGCRRGELVALRWSDIDFSRTPVMVNIGRSISEVMGQTIIKSTKSGRERRVSLAPSDGRQLQLWWSKQRSAAAMAGTTLASDPYVFSDHLDAGTPVSPEKLSYRFRRLAGGSAKIKDIRNINGSYLLASGVPIVNVSERLGHANTTTTFDFYVHSLPAGDDAATAALDRLNG